MRVPFTYMCLATCVALTTAGCPREEPVMKGSLGCTSIDELVARYKKAHEAKDIESLRPLAFWNAQWATRRGDYDPWENAIRTLFDHPLTKVEYVALPKSVDKQAPAEKAPGNGVEQGYADFQEGGQLFYKRRKGRGMASIGGPSVSGKLVLTVDKKVIVDPSFAVVQFEGCYYFDAEQIILFDAAKSLYTGKPTEYVAQPLDTKWNPLE